MNCNSRLSHFVFILFLVASVHQAAYAVRMQLKSSLKPSKSVRCTLLLDHGEALYADSLHFSCDTSGLRALSYRSKTKPLSRYIPSFKQNKQVYEREAEIIVRLGYENGLKKELLKACKQEPCEHDADIRLYCLGFVVNEKQVTRPMCASAVLHPVPNVLPLAPADKQSATPTVPPSWSDQETMQASFPWNGIMLPERLIEMLRTLFLCVVALLLGSFIVAITFIHRWWATEIIRLNVVILGGLLLIVMYPYVPALLFLCAALAFLLHNSWYYLFAKLPPQGDNSYVRYGRYVIAVLCGFLIMPVLIYCYVAQSKEIIQYLIKLF
jgi:hypothetical protein